MGHHDDPLQAAEQQMAEYELGSVSALITKMVRRLGVDVDETPTETQIQAMLMQLIEDDPEARELLETMGTFQATREKEI